MNVPVITQELRTDAVSAFHHPRTAAWQTFDNRNNGAKIEAQRFRSLHGTSASILFYPGGRDVVVLLKGRLGAGAMGNLARALDALPRQTLDLLRGDIFVVPLFGMTISKSGVSETLAATQVDDSPEEHAVFLRGPDIADPEVLVDRVAHETGHVLYDFIRWKKAESLLLGARGETIFGRGSRAGIGREIFESRDVAAGGWPKRNYASIYGSSSASEDFAETHSMALALRREYASGHGGRDFFHLSSAAIRDELRDRAINPLLGEKIECVAKAYRAFRSFTPRAVERPLPE